MQSKWLTPQEIYDVDTFTLEQKIEELENHPQKHLYTSVLHLAKIQLLERLQAENFAVNLLTMPEELQKHAPIYQQKKLTDQYGKKQIFSVRGKQKNNIFLNSSKVQPKLQSCRKIQYVVVGPPTVNHRYQPKKVKKIISISQRNVSIKDRLKKTVEKKNLMPNESLIKIKFKNQSKIQTSQKKLLLTETQQEKFEQMQITKVNQQNELKNEFIKKQQLITNRTTLLKIKLQRQIQNQKLPYQQNDVYDDFVQLKISQIRLFEFNETIDTTTNQSIQNLQIKFKSTQNETEKTEFQSNKSFFALNKISQTVLAQRQIYQQTPQTICQLNKQEKLLINLSKEYQDNLIIQQQVPINKILIQKEGVKQPSVRKNKQNEDMIRIRSLKSFSTNHNKFIQSKGLSEKITQLFQQKITNKLQQTIPYLQKNLKSELLNPTCSLFQTKTDFEHKTKKQQIKQIALMPLSKPLLYVLFPYHDYISSFSKIFPHSKNLLSTLSKLQLQLQSHINKNIEQISHNDQFLRQNREQMLMKLVSQSQKAIKYSYLFDIDLTNLQKRNSTLLSRIKITSNEPLMLYRVVRTKEQVYNIIANGFYRTSNWYELPHGMDVGVSWNLLWTWSKPQIDFQLLNCFQRVNHFLNNKQLARKDLLKKNIQRIKILSDKMRNLFNIIPDTYLLPGQNMRFVRKFKEETKSQKTGCWIMKPVGLSRGRGISVISKLQEVVFTEPVVMQKYLADPLLLDGFKFDMRIYVLVTSINPLQAYVYKEGFARISTEKYSLDDLSNKFVHLTNFSIQKQHMQPNTFQGEIGGSKISLKMLKDKIGCKVWQSIVIQIDQIVIKSLIAVMNVIPQNNNSFQLFGYDIFVDAQLKCWLIEVNSSPSLEKQYFLDQIIKQELINDIFDVVQPIYYDRIRLLEIVSRKKKQLQGLKSHININTNSVSQLDEDIHYILHGRPIQNNKSVQNFRIVAPSDKYYQILKSVQKLKIDPLQKNN